MLSPSLQPKADRLAAALGLTWPERWTQTFDGSWNLRCRPLRNRVDCLVGATIRNGETQVWRGSERYRWAGVPGIEAITDPMEALVAALGVLE